jgi:hypothetical protein
MAGSPIKRARREAAARSKGRFTAADRERILKRAGEIGAAAAAAEAGCSTATLRTWRRRGVEASPAVVAESAGVGGSRTETLRMRANRAREAQDRAENRADAMIASGQAAESRNCTVTAAAFGQSAGELEAAAAAAELHEVKLSEAEAHAVLELIGHVLGELELGVPDAYLAAVLRAGDGPVAAEIVEQARSAVLARIRSRLRSEVEAELAAQRFVARHAPVEGDADDGGASGAAVSPVDGESADGEDIAWEDVRPELRRRFSARPHQAVQAEVEARREESEQGARAGRRAARVSRFDGIAGPTANRRSRAGRLRWQ